MNASPPGRTPRHVYRGQPLSIGALSRLAGVSYPVMQRRLIDMTPEAAVDLGPVQAFGAHVQPPPRRRIVIDGQRRTIVELAAAAGCTEGAMRGRLASGMAPEAALAAGARIGRVHLWQGRPVSTAELARMAGCTPMAMCCRLQHPGRTPEEAVAMGARGLQANRRNAEP